jgi:hypothetical protein
MRRRVKVIEKQLIRNRQVLMKNTERGRRIQGKHKWMCNVRGDITCRTHYKTDSMHRKFVAVVTDLRITNRSSLQMSFLLTRVNRSEPQCHTGVCNTRSLALCLPSRTANTVSYLSMIPVTVVGPQRPYLDANSTVTSPKKSRTWQELLWAQVCDYCEKTTLHGYRYLTEPGRHWVER